MMKDPKQGKVVLQVPLQDNLHVDVAVKVAV